MQRFLGFRQEPEPLRPGPQTHPVAHPLDGRDGNGHPLQHALPWPQAQHAAGDAFRPWLGVSGWWPAAALACQVRPSKSHNPQVSPDPLHGIASRTSPMSFRGASSCYLAAKVMDWHSRKVLAWRVSPSQPGHLDLPAWSAGYAPGTP